MPVIKNLQEVAVFIQNQAQNTIIFKPILKYDEKKKIFRYAKIINKASNELLCFLKKQTEELFKDETFNKYMKERYKLAKKGDRESYDKLVNKMYDKTIEYNISIDQCQNLILDISQRYNIEYSLFRQNAMEIFINVIKYILNHCNEDEFNLNSNQFEIIAADCDQTLHLVNFRSGIKIKFLDMILDLNPTTIAQNKTLKYISKYIRKSKNIAKKEKITISKSEIALKAYKPRLIKIVCQPKDEDVDIAVHIIIDGQQGLNNDKINTDNLK